MQIQASNTTQNTNQLQRNEVDYNELLNHYLQKMQWQEGQSVKECMDLLLSELIPYLGGVKGALYQASPSKQALDLLAGFGINETTTTSKSIKYGEEIVGQVAKTKKSFYQQYSPPIQLFTGTISLMIKGVLVVPVLANQELTGVLEVMLRQPLNQPKHNFLIQLLQHIGSHLKIRYQEQTLRSKNLELEQKNANITSSIKYAGTIQRAILPSTNCLNRLFSDHFLIYKPKDTVSGDFYWANQIKTEASKEQESIIIATLDCTGHGVPGALMSMIGNTLLNQIIHEKKIYDPAQILLCLHKNIQKALNQEESDNQDGMDGGICLIKPMQQSKFQVTYAGAKRCLMVACPNQEVQLIKGDRTSLGGLYDPLKIGIHSKSVTLDKGDQLYLTTDGFEDACNERRKKFGFRKLLQVIQSHFMQPLSQQKEVLLHQLTNHQRNTPQRDDITVLGVKL